MREAAGRSPRAFSLTAAFVVALLVLVALLWVQVRQATNIVLPVGPEPTSPTPSASPGARAVLILNSYHPGYSFSDNEVSGIVDALRQGDPGIETLVEYLDCKRFPGMEHFDRIRDLFARKYAGRDLPVVIAADNPALEFALRYRAELFPGAAIVFCGINGFHPKMIEGQSDVTGVAEILAADETLDLALELHPDTRHVLVVHDRSITGLSTRRQTESQLERFARRVEVSYLPDVTTADLLERLRHLPPDSLVMLLSYSLDKEGRVFNLGQISRLLSEAAPVPVYAVHEERLGYGIMGGSLLGGRLQGERAARMAARILAGEPVAAIPVDLRSPTRAMFDHRQLERFGISPDALPDGAVVVNRPVSFFAAYPGLAMTTLGIIAILASGVVVLASSIHQRRTAEEEQRRLHVQLLQSQKMEAVGQLAGGVAHDFNNILTAIIGHASLLRSEVEASPELTTFVDEILASSERASRLTRSLLAFSRKQVMAKRPVDLNEIVPRVARIAHRLIGEDIEFRTVLQGGTLTVMADAAQIEQVLLNLCTNARDAMPSGGNLTIETDVVDVADAHRTSNLLERPGRYGIIRVSDTGVGMDEATRLQIFEPFFTTKEVGKGTGLGLSIAYGIVKQHEGTINVYSEPGKGTSFKIFLPLTDAVGVALAPRVEAPSAGGSETILLAEDETEVRGLIRLVLRRAGYTVLEAADGQEAVEVFARHGAPVDLLLSDVIMPRRNGKDAYEQMRTRRPGVKVLFMSGYTADIVQGKGMVGEGLPLVSKPIVPDQLLRRVREVLDA